MPPERRYRVIRDPLWNTIRLDPTAARIVDTQAFQRLRYIRQLGFAHLVYPGATHTRFDHAIGVYHLVVTAIQRLKEKCQVSDDIWEAAQLLPYAALLHDIGHYAFSHALEELESDFLPGDHESISARFFESPELSDALNTIGSDAAPKIHALICGNSENPLRGLVAGSLDLDKMEYLQRDARFCGVPYGEVDVGRLLDGITILTDPQTGHTEVGVHEKAVAALESLLFAKYQMFRNVYWHHGVRAATTLYKRIVYEAVRGGIIESNELIGMTDEELIYTTAHRAQDIDSPIANRISTRWIPSLKNRKLPKRALEVTAAELGDLVLEDWIMSDTPMKRKVEDQLATEVGLEPGEVVIDFPAKKSMFQLDLLIERKTGQVQRLGIGGLPGLIDLPRLAQELYTTTRVLRIFTFEYRPLNRDHVLEKITSSG